MVNQLTKLRHSTIQRSDIEIIKEYKLNPTQELKQELLVIHFPLVLHTGYGYKIESNECLSIGSIALLKTLEEFNISESILFSTALTYELRKEFRREIGIHSDIYLPIEFKRVLSKFKKVKDSYNFNIDEFVKDACKSQPTWNFENTKNRLIEYSEYARVGDISIVQIESKPIEINEYKGFSDVVEQIVGSKYMKVMIKYYNGYTFDEIGLEMGFSKQRASTVHKIALGKLQNSKRLFKKYC